VTIVRKDRDSDEWYLGSITDEVGRVLAAPLWFLGPGQDPSLRWVVNGLESGRDFRMLSGVAGRRVPTAGGGSGRVSRPQGSA
jgi:hypothetical protein